MAGQDDGDAPELIDADPGPAVPKRQVPVALITGYLGSGKTTLVRHILRSPHGLRIAVILNEFGEGVENAYFQDIQEDISGLRSSNGDWVELDNGCMCCSVKSEFVLALEALLAKDNKPDYILIETTGLANPGPVAAALWTDEQVEAGVQLDSIITVVDAINIDRQLNAVRAESAVNEAQVQVAYADLILLNKMDLCSDEAIARAEADIRAINSSVHIMHTTNCNVDLHLLLNRQGYKLGTAETILEPIAEDDDNENGDDDDDDDDGEGASPSTGADGEPLDLSVVGTRIIPLTQAVVDGISPRVALGGGMETSMSRNSLARSSAASGGGGHSRGTSLSLDPLGDDKPHGSHDPAIQTVCLTTDAPLNLDRVKSFLDKLLWDREAHPEDIYRVKGVLHIAGQDNKHMVQAVYELYHITPSAAWLAGERRQSRLVIIGRSLNKPLLEQWFAALAAAQP